MFSAGENALGNDVHPMEHVHNHDVSQQNPRPRTGSIAADGIHFPDYAGGVAIHYGWAGMSFAVFSLKFNSKNTKRVCFGRYLNMGSICSK